jgi:alkylation response protein AidB-like acyl-CoA dehydrogenase
MSARVPADSNRQTAGAQAKPERIIESRAEALRRARALVPIFLARARNADKDRRVSEDNIEALVTAGLIRIMAPKCFGGSQLGLTALVETVAEIASGCGSTGWIYGVLAGHNWMLSLFPIEAQREVFADCNSLVASIVRLGGDRPKRVAGGYQIQGAGGRFCSGIDYANWIILGVSVQSDDAAPEARYLLVPRAEVEIVDDWFTAGLRGTGSRSLRIRDAFVPEHRSVSIAEMALGLAPGALYHDSPVFRAPFPQVLPFPLAGVPIGIARSALTVFVASHKAKLAGLPDEQIAEQSASFVRIGNAHAEVDSAAALVMSDSLEIDGTVDGSQTSALDRTRYVRDVAYAANQCRTAVNSLYEAGGGSAIYDSHELQRIWRDLNAAAAHNSFMRDRAGTMFGRAVLGLPPSKFDRIGH